MGSRSTAGLSDVDGGVKKSWLSGGVLSGFCLGSIFGEIEPRGGAAFAWVAGVT